MISSKEPSGLDQELWFRTYYKSSVTVAKCDAKNDPKRDAKYDIKKMLDVTFHCSFQLKMMLIFLILL